MKNLSKIVAFLLVVIMIFTVSACSNQKEYKDTVVTVTDENGKAVTDKNGKAVTTVVATDKDGNTSTKKGETTTTNGDKNKSTTTSKNGSKATTKKSDKATKTTAKATTKAQTYSIKVVVTLPKKQKKDKNNKYQYVDDVLTITDANNKNKVLAKRNVKLNGKTQEFSISNLSGLVNVTATLKNLKASQNEVIKKSKTVYLKIVDPDTTKTSGIEVMDGGLD